MGKSKAQKRSSKRKRGSSPYDASKGESPSAGAKPGGLLANLCSVEESKRLEGCKILIGLFESGTAPLETLASDKILNAIAQRLGDTSGAVRLEASGAAHNIAATLNPTICERMVSSGVFSTALGFVREYCEKGDGALGVSAEIASRIISQLLSCIAGIVASHEITTPESNLLDSVVHGYVLRLAVEATTHPVKRSAVDLLAVLTDDTQLSCEYLASLDGVNVLRAQLHGDSCAISMTSTKTSLIQLGFMNIILNIFSNIPTVQSQCEIVPMVNAALTKIALPEDIVGSIKLRSEEEHIDEALEIVKGAGEFLANAASNLLKDKDVEESGTNDMDVESKRELSVDESHALNGLRTDHVLSTIYECVGISFGVLEDLIGQKRPINFHCVSLLDVLDRLVSAISNITNLRTNTPNNIKGLVDLAESLLEGAARCTAYADESGKKDTSQMWPIEETLDTTSVMDKFSTTAATVLGALSVISQRSNVEPGDTKIIATLICRAVSSPNHDVIVKGVDLATAIGVNEKIGLPVPLHAIITNSLLRRVTVPSAFRVMNVSNTAAIIKDMTGISTGVCIEGIIDLHSGDNLDCLKSFVKLGAIDKIQSAFAGIDVDKLRRDAELIESGELAHLHDVLDNVEPFLEYKRSAIRSAKL